MVTIPFLNNNANTNHPLPKLVVLLGPTAAGKTEWSLKLAKEFNGDIISADSRQIYKKMDIGTAKAIGEWKRNGLRKTYYVEDVPHHLIDFLDPGKTFSVAEFRDRALKYCKLANQEGRLPMIVGGTGLYISAIIDNFNIPRVPANKKLRKSLEEKTCQELLALLHNLDPEAAKTIDQNNKRRMIRALEVCIFTGEPFSEQKKKGERLFDVLQIGVDVPRDILHERINDRIDTMMKLGLLKEVERLMMQKYSWDLPSMNGVGYRQFKEYFDGTQSLDQTIERLKKDTRAFARRQMTWFRRDTSIRWCSTYEEAHKLIQLFLSQP